MEELDEINALAFTMDYEKKEIVLRCCVGNGDYKQLRLCEKDVRSMASWFDLAHHLDKK